MPQLRSPIFSVDFQDIPQYKDSWPAEYREVATLIERWLNGETEFQIRTSGSTGEPKDFVLEKELILQSVRQTADALRIKAGDVLFCCLSPTYIAGMMMVFRAVALDCHLYMVPPSSDPLAEVPEDEKLDMAAFIPMQLQTLLHSREPRYRQTLNRMKGILVGGGIVDEGLEDQVKSLTVPVFHTYGMTETYTHVALRRINGPKASEYFYPLPGVKISMDSRGCLVVTSSLTKNEPLVTNDLVKFNTDGGFRWAGRFDNVINSGGIKIPLDAVEHRCEGIVRMLLGPRRILAAGLPDTRLGQKLVLFIEGEEPKEGVLAELLQKKLIDADAGPGSEFYRIRQIIYVPEFKLTHTGKVDRRKTLESLNIDQ